MSDVKPLDPPDPKRCQCEITVYEPFRFGVGNGCRTTKRCENQPAVIATEVQPGKDGQRGSMSLCDSCKDVFLKQLGATHATFEPIKAAK